MTTPKLATSVDLDELTPCHLCGLSVMHSHPIFYEVTVASCIRVQRNVEQLIATELLTGSSATARALPPTTTVAARMPAERRLVCYPCFTDPEVSMIQLIVEEKE